MHRYGRSCFIVFEQLVKAVTEAKRIHLVGVDESNTTCAFTKDQKVMFKSNIRMVRLAVVSPTDLN